MELVSSKILVLTLLGVLRLFFGLLPLKITKYLQEWGKEGKRRAQVDVVISLCLCFGGGVLMATCFIHMIPEVRESLVAVQHSGGLAPFESSFPFAELLICCGFFLVYIMEEAAQHLFLRSHEEKTGTPLHCSSASDPEKALESDGRVEVAPWSGRSGKIMPATSQAHLLSSSTTPEHAQSSPPLGAERSSDIVQKRSANPTRQESRLSLNQKLTQIPDSPNKRLSEPSIHHQHFCSVQEHSLVGNLRNFLVVVALSFHSVFEGLAIGLQPTHADVWYLFTAVSIHAAAILFCIGLELAASGAKILQIVVYIVILALVSPLGVIIGILVTAHSTVGSVTQTLLIAILQGLAGGTILYITFFEVLDRERKKETGCGAVRIVSILLGFSLMVALQLFGGHDHSKGEGHTIFPSNTSAELLHDHDHKS